MGIHAGIAHLASGVNLADKGGFRSALAFDDYDLWFGNDFTHMMDNWMEDVLEEMESMISSVDSTNLSEAHSEQISAQSSADRAAQIAAGITPSEATSRASDGGEEDSRVSTDESDSSASTNSDAEEITTLDHEHTGRHGGHDEGSESVYSGRSWSDDDDSGLSDSEGTSQATGEASTLTSVSFEIVEYANIHANENNG